MAPIGAAGSVGADLGEGVGRIVVSGTLSFVVVLLAVTWVENRDRRGKPKDPSD